MDDGINSRRWKEKDGRYGSEKNGQNNLPFSKIKILKHG